MNVSSFVVYIGVCGLLGGVGFLLAPDLDLPLVRFYRSLPFFDVLVSTKPDGSLGHTVYRNLTPTDLYLHAKSAHHPAQKKGSYTLSYTAHGDCDADSLDKELKHLKETFKINGYSNRDIRRAVQKEVEPRQKKEKPVAVARLH
jgi:hypothetical protein